MTPLILALFLAPASAEPLDLDEALLAASRHNPSLAVAEVELDKAQAQLNQARGLVLPMAQAGAQWTHMDHEDTVDFSAMMGSVFEDMGFPMEIDDTGDPTVLNRQDTVSATLGASWSVLSPRSWATLRVAREGRDLSELSVDQVQQELLLATAQAWYASAMTGTLVELQEQLVVSAEEHLEVSTKRLDAGAGLRIDVVRAETDLAQAKQDLLGARLADESARDGLGLLTGLGGLVEPGEAGELRLPAAEETDLVAHALERREDVALAHASVEVQRAALGLSRSQWMPSLDLAWQGTYAFTEPGEMGSDDPTRWAAVASLTVPLYGHSMVGDVAEQKASLRQAELRLEETELLAGQAVRQAVRDRSTTLAAVELAEERAVLAQEGLALTETAYAQGAGSSFEVSDARANLVAAEVNRLTTGLQADMDALVLLRALGGDMLSAVQ